MSQRRGDLDLELVLPGKSLCAVMHELIELKE